MLALLRKEWYVMGKTVIQVTVLWLVVAALFVWMDNVRAAWLYCCNVPILSLSFSLNSLDMDNRCRWDDWLAVTPLSPWKVVLSKYVFTGEALLLLTVCGALAGRLVASTETDTVLMWPAAALTVLMTGTDFPLVYHLGRLKGTLLSLAIWLSLLLLVMAGDTAGIYQWMQDISLPEGAGVALLLAVWTALSLRLSVRLYDKRRRGMCD